MKKFNNKKDLLRLGKMIRLASLCLLKADILLSNNYGKSKSVCKKLYNLRGHFGKVRCELDNEVTFMMDRNILKDFEDCRDLNDVFYGTHRDEEGLNKLIEKEIWPHEDYRKNQAE